MFPSTKRGAWARAGCSIVLCCATLSIAQGVKPAQISEVPAVELVRDTVAQEVAAANRNDSKHLFLSQMKTAKGSQTKLYVETNDALAGMLVAINDKPLDAQQHQAEVDHLAWLTGSPEQLKKKHAREKDDEERTLRIVKAMPEAFRYQYDGTEMGSAELGKNGAELSRLKFTPNPAYSPPSRVEQVLQGMEGYLLIDRSARRIARIDGTLFREVTFGWGIIGHLDKGGRFRVQQADVGDGSWNITEMSLRMTGKILLFKSLSMISDETFSQFHKVPEDLPFGKGVELLKAEQEKIAHSGSIQSAAISKASQ